MAVGGDFIEVFDNVLLVVVSDEFELLVVSTCLAWLPLLFILSSCPTTNLVLFFGDVIPTKWFLLSLLLWRWGVRLLTAVIGNSSLTSVAISTPSFLCCPLSGMSISLSKALLWNAFWRIQSFLRRILLFSVRLLLLLSVPSSLISPMVLRLSEGLSFSKVVAIVVVVSVEGGLSTSNVLLPVSETTPSSSSLEGVVRPSFSQSRVGFGAFDFLFLRTLLVAPFPTLLLRRFDWRPGPDTNSERRSLRNLNYQKEKDFVFCLLLCGIMAAIFLE